MEQGYIFYEVGSMIYGKLIWSGDILYGAGTMTMTCYYEWRGHIIWTREHVDDVLWPREYIYDQGTCNMTTYYVGKVILWLGEYDMDY